MQFKRPEIKSFNVMVRVSTQSQEIQSHYKRAGALCRGIIMTSAHAIDMRSIVCVFMITTLATAAGQQGSKRYALAASATAAHTQGRTSGPFCSTALTYNVKFRR